MLKRVVIVAVLLVVGAPLAAFAYFQFVQKDPPGRLALSDSTSTTSASESGSSAASGELGGTWKPTSGSQVGYRVKENAFGQSGEAVGRTSSVTGTMTIDGTTVTAVEL